MEKVCYNVNRLVNSGTILMLALLVLFTKDGVTMKFIELTLLCEVGLIVIALIIFEIRYYQDYHCLVNPWRHMVEVDFKTYVRKYTRQVYFYGFPLLEILDKGFIPRFRTVLECGLCFEVSALMMLTFHNNRTARIVRAKIWDDSEQIWIEHSWLELRYHGIWFLIDPCWQFPYAIFKKDFYEIVQMKNRRVCGRDEFMSYSISQQFAKKLRDPETSCLLAELMFTYRPHTKDAVEMFDPRIKERRLSSFNGRIVCPVQAVYAPKILCISRGIVKDYMDKEKRLRPKAKTLRRYYAACRHAARYGYMGGVITFEQFEALLI